MRQKLFTKQIDDMLFKQYAFGNDLSKQKAVAKIFNPYGSGVWYLLNSDPSDPDYIWAIVDLFEIEVGSVSRESLEMMKVPPFKLNLERDMYFQPINASELLNRLRQGETFAKGGKVKGYKIYHDTLSQTLEEAEEFFHNEGYLFTSDNYFPDVTNGGIAYGETVRITRPIQLQGKSNEGVANIQIYRMDSGRYELNMYPSYANGGEMDERGSMSYAKMKGKESIDWDKELREYAGNNYSKLSEMEKEEIISDMQRDFDRGYSFANGGELQIVKNESGENYLATADSTPNQMAVKLANGGKIKNQYEGRTPDDIWNNLSKEQRGHFLYDHEQEIANYKGIEELSSSEIRDAYNSDWTDLDEDIKNRFENHTRIGQYADGGELEEGVDLFEDYDDIPDNVQEILNKYQESFEDGDYSGLKMAHEELSKIGYTFEYGLDGEAYDLRKIGQKGKSEEMEDDDYADGGTLGAGSYKNGGEIKVEEGDMIKSKTVKGKVYQSTGTMFKLEDEYGNKNPKYFSTKDFKKSEIIKMAKGVKFSTGGMTAGRWYRDNTGKEFRFIGRKDSGVNEGKLVFNDGTSNVYKTLDEFGSVPKEKKLFGLFKEGGKMAKGGEITPYIIWVSKDGENKEFYGEYKSMRAANMKMNKLWETGEYKLIGNKPKSKYEKEGFYEEGGTLGAGSYAKGGKTTFNDKVKAISKSLLKRKKVSPKVQKDYGKTYNKKEAVDSAKRIAGAMKNKTMAKDSKLKVNGDDFSFLLELSDSELSKRLDLVRKQQGINGKQYFSAKEKKESTTKIEESRKRLDNQEKAIIEARVRKSKKKS